MLARVDSRELTEMIAEFDLQPWGETELWELGGRVARSMVAGKWDSKDFDPTPEIKQPAPSPKQLREKVLAFSAMLRAQRGIL